MTAPRTKREAYVSCLSCGNTSKTFLLVGDDGSLPHKGMCPRCSNTAYTQNLTGLWAFMEASAREIAQIKLDMIDLQDAPEDR